uniref:Uncharacterized protein n=1 Tax=Lactuca sativa TaxID=4236 RepID=A0A9R1V596_LACSA|nr:hypothetical protein LSAT_V11C600335840 [Lactuca sativa]
MLKLSRFKLNVLIREILKVQCTSLVDTNSPLQTREKMYLLAVGYYRSGDYSKSRQLVDRCLEVGQTSNFIYFLFIDFDFKILICIFGLYFDGVIGIGIAATTIGVVFGGIVAAMARR